MKMEELVRGRLSDNSDIRVGIDVGSTTVKLVITDINTNDVNVFQICQSALRYVLHIWNTQHHWY